MPDSHRLAGVSPKMRTVGLTSLAMICFAANSLLCRAALAGGHADAASFTLLRLIGGAVVLAVLARFRGSPAPASRFAWGSAVALTVYAIGFSLAYLRIPAGSGALILFAAVQLAMISVGLRQGERPRVAEWAGLGLSIAGLVVLTHPGLARPDPVGALLMAGAGVAWGAYSLRGRGSADAVGGNAASFARAVPFAVIATVVALLLHATHLDPRGAFLALVSGALTSGVGYALWYAALGGLTATRAAIVQLMVPPLAATGGVLVLGEPFSLRLAIASAFILGGIAIATLNHAPYRKV